jgi:RHS repeat-associated protein
MEYKYDSRNNNKHTTDRENHITRREYDLMNRLNENIYQLATGDISVKYGLDKNGRLVSQTDDNGNTTTYGYDDVNRRISETMPDNNSHKSYFFNQYGALDGMIDNNESGISYTYNSGLQMTQKDINKGTGVEGVIKETFTYDGNGRMIEAVNYITEAASSTVAMSYDSFGNVLKETQNGKEIKSTYDVLSFRTQLEYPSGNKTINFVPDYLNRIESITQNSQPIAQYTYAGPGRVTDRVYNNGNGPTLHIDYDDGRRAITYTHGATIGGFGYSFDKMNNKLYENRTFDSKGDAVKYDEIYRLTGVKYGVTNLNPSTDYSQYTGNPEELYSLDGVGNRLEVGNGLVSTTYTANALNQYQTISGTELTNLDYDLNGNLRWDGVITCTYNYLNQLTKVIRSDGQQTLGEYKYDCLGRRIWKKAWNEDTQSSTETNFYYDGARCIEEQTTGGITIATYVFGNRVDEVLTMDRNSETYYFHENSLGSIYAVTTGTGTVAERYSYNAYGEVTFLDANGNSIVTSTIGNRILFTGREFDSETGLYYYRARYYSAEQGRFFSRDPAEDDSIGNLYAYVSNNPLSFVDSYGLWAIVVDLPEDRSKPGSLVLYDDNGDIQLYAVVKGQGDTKWWEENGDTPTGEWTGKIVPPQAGEKNAEKCAEKAYGKRCDTCEKYGVIDMIRLTAVSDHAKEAVDKYKRKGFLIHAGRENKATEAEVLIPGELKKKEVTKINPETGKKETIIEYEQEWKKEKRKIPHRTWGCLRVWEDDMIDLVNKINELVENGEDAEGNISVFGPQEDAPKPKAKTKK